MDISIAEVEPQPLEDAKVYEVTIYNQRVGATVTSSDSVADWWIETHFCDCDQCYPSSVKVIIGLDVEWRPNFNRNEGRSPIATIQIFSKKCCLVFQILRCNYIPESLQNLLNNNRFIFVGKGIESDAEKLMEDYDLEVSRFVDVGDLAAQAFDDKKFGNMGLKGLVKVIMGEDMEKPKWLSLSKWDANKLSPAQVKYACVDAYYSYKLGKRLLK